MSVRLAAGRLKHSVALQRFVEAARNDANEPDAEGAWETVATVKAEVIPLAGKEYLASRAVQSETTHKVTIWFRRGVTPKMRLLYCGRPLEIESVMNLEEANVALEMMCVERP